MAEVLRMSAKAASIAVTRPGAAPSIPYRREVLDGEGKIDPEKLRAISYDSANRAYLRVGEKVGTAFSDGKKLN